MKPSNCKAKGKKFEEQIADKIHKYFLQHNEEYKKLFILAGNEQLKPKRDSSSGNFTNSNGDVELGLLRKFFPVSIECKHHKDLNLPLNLLLSDNIGKLFKIYFDQAVISAEKVGLLPIVVFKANYTKTFCFWHLPVFNLKLSFLDSVSYIKLGHNFVITLFEDFLYVFNNKRIASKLLSK